MLKTNEELNKQSPHLRDVLVVIDGLNILDIKIKDSSIWLPRLSFQISGDQGTDVEGRRNAFLNAAKHIRDLLLYGNISDGNLKSAFVPHANIERHDYDKEVDMAVAATRDLIKRLESVDLSMSEQFTAKCSSLYITVSVIDFDLTEKRILSEEAWANLEKALNEPAAPSDKLVELMGERKYVIR